MRANVSNTRKRQSELARKVACILAALGLALALSLGASLHFGPYAYASINPQPGGAVAEQVSEEAAASEEAASDEGQAASGETIADEENPLSSGLGGSEPMAMAGANLQWVIVAGIVAVVVFFGVSTLKVNKSIGKMNDRLR